MTKKDNERKDLHQKFLDELKTGYVSTHKGIIDMVTPDEYVIRTVNKFDSKVDQIKVYLKKEWVKDEILKLISNKNNNSFVKYKVLYFNEENDKFYATTKIDEYYKTLKDQKVMLMGKVIKFIDLNSEKCAVIKCLGDELYMPITEFTYLNYEPNEEKILEKAKVAFYVDKIIEDNIFVSKRKLMEDERDSLIEELKNGTVINAIIMSIESWGAKLKYQGHPLILRNKDFSTDYTKIDKVYKKGDMINVKLTEISNSKRILVEPVIKQTSNNNFDYAGIERGDLVVGEVVTVATIGIFVNIYPGVDILCPVPDPSTYLEPIVGNSVMVKISKVDPTTKKVRGYITRIIPDEKEFEDDDLIRDAIED